MLAKPKSSPHQLHGNHLERGDQPWDDKPRQVLLDPGQQCWAGSEEADCVRGCPAAGRVAGVWDEADQHWQGSMCYVPPALWCASQVGQNRSRVVPSLGMVLSLQAPRCFDWRMAACRAGLSASFLRVGFREKAYPSARRDRASCMQRQRLCCLQPDVSARQSEVLKRC